MTKKQKMKKYIFLTIILYFGCTVKYFLPLGPKGKYFLNQNEKYVTIDSQFVRTYQYYIDRDTIHQIPLNSIIKSDKYTLYTGFAINDTPKDIFNFLTNNDYLTVIKKDSLTESKNYKIYRIFDRNENFYSYKLIFGTQKTVYTIVMTYLSQDSAFIASLFADKQIILKKIKL